MRTGLIAVGANIAVVSALASLYGLLSSNPQLVGIGLSGVITGLAILGVGTTPREGPRESLLETLKLLLNSHASILESIDLLTHNLWVIGGDPPLLIATLAGGAERVDPGIGVWAGSPYLAIPLTGVAEDVGALGELSEAGLRNALSDLLTVEYQVAGVVDAGLEDGGVVRVSLLGVRGEFRELQGYPLDPLVLLVLVLLYRLTGRSVRLIEYSVVGDGLELRARLAGGEYWRG